MLLRSSVDCKEQLARTPSVEKMLRDGRQSQTDILGPLPARSDVYEAALKTAWHTVCAVQRVHTTTPSYSLCDRLGEALYSWVCPSGLVDTHSASPWEKEHVVRRCFHNAAAACGFRCRAPPSAPRLRAQLPIPNLGKFKVIVEEVVYHYRSELLGVVILSDP